MAGMHHDKTLCLPCWGCLNTFHLTLHSSPSIMFASEEPWMVYPCGRMFLSASGLRSVYERIWNICHCKCSSWFTPLLHKCSLMNTWILDTSNARREPVNGPMNPWALGQLVTQSQHLFAMLDSHKDWHTDFGRMLLNRCGSLLDIHATDILPSSQHFQEQGRDTTSILLNHNL